MRERFMSFLFFVDHLNQWITTRYDIFAINIAAQMLGYVYGKNHSLNTNQSLGVKVATPIGTLVGQLLFGWLADVVGRKRMCKLDPYFNLQTSSS
jgi:MFS family permease